MGHIDTTCQAFVSEYFIFFDPHLPHVLFAVLETFFRGNHSCPQLVQRHTRSRNGSLFS